MDISRKWNRLAIRLSALTMLGVLGILSFWILHQEPGDSRRGQDVEMDEALGGDTADSAPPEKTPEQIKEELASKAHAEEEFKEMLQRKGEQEADMVNRNLSTAMRATEGRSFGENMVELDRREKQLEKYASEKSLDRIAELIPQWTGAEPRAAAPVKNPPPGDFNIDTAQFHDVTRTGTEAEGFRYMATLFDAEGRSMEVEMGAEEGKKMWELMRKMKKNPMMDKIYRGMVLPMMDKAMKK